MKPNSLLFLLKLKMEIINISMLKIKELVI